MKISDDYIINFDKVIFEFINKHGEQKTVLTKENNLFVCRIYELLEEDDNGYIFRFWNPLNGVNVSENLASAKEYIKHQCN